MIIIHKINEVILDLFPEAKTKTGYDKGKLETLLKDFYEYQGNKPQIEILNDTIKIIIDTDKITKTESEYNKLISLCEKGKFVEAKQLAEKLISIDPTNSEFYRILGQIYSDKGNQDEAINQLIYALKWDSHNKWALIMMGNIFAKYKDDIQTGIKYYEEAVAVDPKNNIVMNNIAAALMEKGDLNGAKKYFEKALMVNANYPNTHYGLGLVADVEKDYKSAFYKSIDTLKLINSKSGLYKPSLQLALSSSQKLIEITNIDSLIKEYIFKLEYEGDKKIIIEVNNDIPTVAKLEVAENYDRDEHLIKYKSDSPVSSHLVMHELVHLDFIIQARKQNLNNLYTTTGEHRQRFIKSLEKDLTNLHKKGYPENQLANYVSSIFDGLNSQIFNTPIDLFIEDFLFNTYEHLKPFQFISLYLMNKDGMSAVTLPKIVELSPKDVLSKSKILNIVNALHFKNLFGVDFIEEMKPNKLEMSKAKLFYEEFEEYRQNRKPAEEYELVQHWGDDLNFGKYFELVDEIKYRKKRLNPLDLLDDIENDPYDILTEDPYKKQKMDTFLKEHDGNDINMAVVMYMVGAIQKYSNISKTELQKIAFEIATIGTQGIDPKGEGYKVSSIPNKTFSGYHLLAYYYVTWKLFNPDMHKMLQLPFDNEYELAKTLA